MRKPGGTGTTNKHNAHIAASLALDLLRWANFGRWQRVVRVVASLNFSQSHTAKLNSAVPPRYATLQATLRCRAKRPPREHPSASSHRNCASNAENQKSSACTASSFTSPSMKGLSYTFRFGPLVTATREASGRSDPTPALRCQLKREA